jgi:hypothetical protein
VYANKPGTDSIDLAFSLDDNSKVTQPSYTFTKIDCAKINDAGGKALSLYAHLLINPTDGTKSKLKFFTDATCTTAATTATLTVTATASSDTAKCFDYSYTKSDSSGADIKALSVVQDASDTTLYTINSYDKVHTSTDTCDGGSTA